MTLDFYATIEDRQDILNFIFSEMKWEIYDTDIITQSDNLQELMKYNSSEQIENKISSKESPSTRFAAYSHLFGGGLTINKVVLNTRKNALQEYRYEPKGWGLIYIEFGNIWQGKLQRSIISHNTKIRAHNWANNYPEMAGPELWDWKEVETSSRKLASYIKKLAVLKFHDSSYVAYVLPNAKALLQIDKTNFA